MMFGVIETIVDEFAVRLMPSAARHWLRAQSSTMQIMVMVTWTSVMFGAMVAALIGALKLMSS